MALKLFGFTILTPQDILERTTTKPSVVPPQNVDGAATVFEGGLGVFGGYSVDFDTYGAYTNEIDLINQYRDLSLQPEVDEAIGDIINELIVRDFDDSPVTISVDGLPDVYDENFRELVRKEFEHVLTMLQFKNRCYDIARQFYVDGRLYYDLVIDEHRPQRGIIDLRNIDPRMIRPVRELKQSMHQETGVRLTEVTDEYFVYSPQGFRNMTNVTHNTIGTRLTKDRIAYINSGIYTPGNTMVLSWLHKAIKPFNQLRMVEDATVIYRITRAPERRAFYIDVADLPTHRAEQYIQSVANRYRNRVVYDSTTGEVRDDRKIQSMLEDFFLPRRSNGRGTEVQTLPGGQNLGEIQDIDYFKKKLYRALNLPPTRTESGGGQFQMGRTTEITRDEIKFSRFLTRLRGRISMLFDEIMERHLTLKGIIRSRQQWKELRTFIKYDYATDSHFAELKTIEILKERLSVVQDADQYVGKYFSEEYVKHNILGLSPDEQRQIQRDVDKMKATTPKETPEGGAGELSSLSSDTSPSVETLSASELDAAPPAE